MNAPDITTPPPAELEGLDVADLHELGLWPPGREYLVYYSLSGMMLVRATHESEASDKVFTTLHVLVGRMGQTGLTADEASNVGLADPVVEIDSVEAVEYSGDSP